MVGEEVEGIEVAPGTAALDRGYAGGADIRAPAELFAAVGVGEMDLYRRQSHRFEGVEEGDTAMGVGAGVDDDPINSVVGALDGIDKVAFMVRLNKFCGYTELIRFRTDQLHQFAVRNTAVELLLADTEHIQVGPVNYQYSSLKSLQMAAAASAGVPLLSMTASRKRR